MDIPNRFAEFIESFNSGGAADSEFFEEFISEFPESVFVHPEHKLGMGSVVVARFLDIL